MKEFKLKTLIPMHLQFFGEDPNPPEPSDDSDNPLENEDNPESGDGKDDLVDKEKIIDKLQKRIGKEQAEKNETKNQLEEALARIQELEENSKKSVKTKSDEEKLAEQQKAKDEEIKQLKSQIRLAEITQQADEVLKESGLALSRDELALVINEDEEKTYSNVKTLLGLLESQRSAWLKERNKGNTPKKMPDQEINAFSAVMEKYK